MHVLSLMIVLGIEGTAHTIGVGILDENTIYANLSHMYRPAAGGIHPREAADHHFNHVTRVITSALHESGLSMADIDLVAYSKGPGLGPCLKIAATAARSLSVLNNIPIVGANHSLGHVEIGRRLTGVQDPAVLYLSGGNTQVIAHESGRYRVFGETTDIGIGNMLDKFARSLGLPFPGGPEIERIAAEGSRLYELPYSVKGMDSSFSGMLTAALRLTQQGAKPSDMAYSLQETAFSMMVEVLERAIKHLGKSSVLLTGGVARNQRVRTMVKDMAGEIGIDVGLTPGEFCSDNGAMIAQAALLIVKHGKSEPISETVVEQSSRIDQTPVPWMHSTAPVESRDSGAEASIRFVSYDSRKAVEKIRHPKRYRVHDLDLRVRKERTRNEISLLSRLSEAGVKVPTVYDFSMGDTTLIMERIEGTTVSERLHSHLNPEGLVKSLGKMVASMHNASISHGDLTTSNILVSGEDDLTIIDPSMGNSSAEIEDIATDVFLLTESLRSNHSDIPTLEKIFIGTYSVSAAKWEETRDIIREIERRRRYLW